MPAGGETSSLFKSNDTLNEMLSTSYTYAQGFPGISHGFWEKYYTVETLGHWGNTDSFSSYFTIAPIEGLGLVVMTNQSNEAGLCSELAKELFGEYSSDYTGTLPDAHEVEGSYMMARRPYSGFSKLMGYLSLYDVKAVDNNTIELAGTKYTQISPYIFQNNGGSEALALPDLMELLPVAGGEKSLMIISIILAIVCALYLIAAIFIIIIGGIRNRKRGIPTCFIKKLNIILNLAGIAAIINTAVIVIRALQYSTYAALQIHFGINIVYMIFAALCIGLMFVNKKKYEVKKWSKLFCLFSCIISIILIALMIVWEFYK